MKNNFTLAILMMFASGFLKAQSPDWSNKIASIIYNNCSSCHHEGSIGPFNLMSYEDAVERAFSIQSYVVSRKMPPWPADNSCSYPMLDNRSLSDADINAINDWVNNGAPSGDLNTAPVPPVFNYGTQLASVDQTVVLPHYKVQLSTDEYRTFVIPSGYTTKQYINQIEVVPGNNEVVHHVLFYYDPTSASYNKDMLDTLAGFSTNGADIPSSSCIMIGGWAPGANPDILPANMAYEVPANADFVVEVHYAKGSFGAGDSTKINLKFCEQVNPRLVKVEPILFHYWPSINTTLSIPANTIKSFSEKSIPFMYPGDYSLLGVSPHCHLIGKTWDVYMTSPGNTDTTRLLCIPNWDFHWQVGYGFKNLVRWNAGGGYTLRAEATYDNTSNNPNNPSNPPVDVVLGESTTDEMMVVFFTYLDYQPGDEFLDLEGNVGISNTGQQQVALSLFPNPSTDQIDLDLKLNGTQAIITMYSCVGKKIRSLYNGDLPNGVYHASFSIDDLFPGIYFVEVLSGSQKVVKEFVKQ